MRLILLFDFFRRSCLSTAGGYAISEIVDSHVILGELSGKWEAHFPLD